MRSGFRRGKGCLWSQSRRLGLALVAGLGAGDGRRLGAFEGVAGLAGVEPLLGSVGVFGGELEAEVAAAELAGDGQRCAAAGEGVEHEVAGVRASADDAAQDLLGHLAAVPACAFLEGAADAGDAPGVAVGLEAVGHVLRAENPGVVGQATLGVGPLVGIDQLAGGGDADGLVVEAWSWGP